MNQAYCNGCNILERMENHKSSGEDVQDLITLCADTKCDMHKMSFKEWIVDINDRYYAFSVRHRIQWWLNMVALFSTGALVGSLVVYYKYWDVIYATVQGH